MRRIALLSKQPDDLRARHLIGAEVLPFPGFIYTQPEGDSGLTLVRIAPDGQFAGDTWHPTFDEALGQLAFEYGDAIGPWQDYPQDVDPVDFGLSLLNQR